MIKKKPLGQVITNLQASFKINWPHEMRDAVAWLKVAAFDLWSLVHSWARDCAPNTHF